MELWSSNLCFSRVNCSYFCNLKLFNEDQIKSMESHIRTLQWTLVQVRFCKRKAMGFIWIRFRLHSVEHHQMVNLKLLMVYLLVQKLVQINGNICVSLFLCFSLFVLVCWKIIIKTMRWILNKTIYFSFLILYSFHFFGRV